MELKTETAEKANEIKSLFFKNINNIEKLLARLTKHKKENM